MKKLCLLIFLTGMFAFIARGQNRENIPPPPCYANGNSGFGGAVGLNSLFRGTTNSGEIFFSIGLGPGFNDIFVLYIATGASGRSILDSSVDDDADIYRIAISNSDAFGYGSNIYFPEGFEVTHAVAIDANYAGLWSIPNNGTVGSGELNFIASVLQEGGDIRFNYSDLGLSYGDYFYFVGLYVSDSGYTSDEGYGDGIIPNTQGADDVVFTSYRGFTNQAGCGYVLGTLDLNNNSFTAYFTNGNLNINGLNDNLVIKVYDLYGRLLQQSAHQINGSLSLPMKLSKKQLLFIVIEGINTRKVIKTIGE